MEDKALIINVRVDACAVANVAAWFRERGVTEATRTLSTVIRSAVELLNERVIAQGGARARSVTEAVTLLANMGIILPTSTKGRRELLKQLAAESLALDEAPAQETQAFDERSLSAASALLQGKKG